MVGFVACEEDSFVMMPDEFASAGTLPNALVIRVDAPLESGRLKNSSTQPRIRFAAGAVPENPAHQATDAFLIKCAVSVPERSKLLYG